MAKFKYIARTNEGKVQSGHVEANTVRAASSLLKSKGLIVVSLKSEGASLDVGDLVSKIWGVSYGDVVDFTRQLSTMISAGLSLAEALDILKNQASNKRFREILESVQSDVSGGTSFAQALAQHPDVFDQTYISLLMAGESSGTLDEVLLRLADNLEKSRAFRSKLKGAMIYPIIIMVAMIGVMVIMIVFVIPQLSTMYESLDIELPLPTRMLIWLSDFFINRWYIIIGGLAAVIIGFNYFRKTVYGKRFLDTVFLKIPVFGNITKLGELTEFSRTLALLMRSGVNIIDSLRIVGNSMRNTYYREALYEAEKQVEKGIPLSDPITSMAVFPPLVGQMIRVGEKTGKMDEVLFKVSAYFEAESDQAVKNLSTALDPIIMVMLGLMVGVLILSIITPIYNLTASF